LHFYDESICVTRSVVLLSYFLRQNAQWPIMECPMTKLFARVTATALICGSVFTSMAATAASTVDKIALQKATWDRRAQVNE
jgi:hypothetical protein